MSEVGPRRMSEHILGLSDADLSRLEAGRSRSSVMLTDVQKRLLDELAGVLQQASVYQAVSLDLISAQQWPGGVLCYDEISFLGLQLSTEQFEKLRKLRSEPKGLRLQILTDSQLKRLAAFEAKLKLLNEAIDLGLISKPALSETLCH